MEIEIGVKKGFVLMVLLDIEEALNYTSVKKLFCQGARGCSRYSGKIDAALVKSRKVLAYCK